MMQMNIATALNSKYMRYTYVMLTSLLENNVNPEYTINIYLLHNNLTVQDQEALKSLVTSYKQNIHFLYIDNTIFPNNLPTTQAWSLETYFRLMLLDILPNDIDRLLYLDVDMIINKPLFDIYNTDFDGKLFCACKDMTVTFPVGDSRDTIFHDLIHDNLVYFNAGFMLWNIEKLKNHCRFNDYMALAETLHFQMAAPDQDLLNYMHHHQVKYLDEYQYNLFSKFAYNHGIRYHEVVLETTIIHFAGMKPWEGQYIHYDIEKLWWDYAKLTPYYYELMEEFLIECIENPLIYNTIDSMAKEKEQIIYQLNKSNALVQKLASLVTK